jgi:hypothetical protein
LRISIRKVGSSSEIRTFIPGEMVRRASACYCCHVIG